VERGTLVQSYIVGLGGGDIRPEHVRSILDDLETREQAGDPVFIEAGV
jgi:hypothetical protein